MISTNQKYPPPPRDITSSDGLTYAAQSTGAGATKPQCEKGAGL